MTAISSNYTTSGNGAEYTTGDTLTLAIGAYVISTAAEGLVLGGSSQIYDLRVDGLLSGAAGGSSGGIYLEGSSNSADITIGRSGVVRGDNGLYLEGAATVENNGSIVATTQVGIFCLSNADYSITNTGHIVSYGANAIEIGVNATGLHTIVNSGVITALAGGGWCAIFCDPTSIESISNTGIINGTVSLNGGDDIVHNDNGGVINGVAYLGGGADQLYGGALIDQVNGDTGADLIYGYGGNDVLDGGEDDDTIDGGLGNDTLTGGTGSDTFIFVSRLTAANVDTITDFSRPDDTFELDNAMFKGLADGTLKKAFFTEVASAVSNVGVDANDRILYDRANGDLYFDQDGSGKHYARVKFAEVADDTVLGSNDFHIV